MVSNLNLFRWKILLYLSVVGALKLTPVQQIAQRIDLSNELIVTSHVLVEAFQKYQEEVKSGTNLTGLFESIEFQKIESVVSRWLTIEARLKSAVLMRSSNQVICPFGF